jgi:hypothetical protein
MLGMRGGIPPFTHTSSWRGTLVRGQVHRRDSRATALCRLSLHIAVMVHCRQNTMVCVCLKTAQRTKMWYM